MCGVFGWIKGKNCKATDQELYGLTKGLAKASEVRGTDASGVATFITPDKLIVRKTNVKGSELVFPKLFGKSLVGHTRATTQGSEKLKWNNHPFYPDNREFVMAHNGVIYNDKKLRKQEDLSQTIIETDSYIITQLLDKKGFTQEDLKESCELLDGSFAVPVATADDKFFFLMGGNPVELFYSQKLNLYVYASTSKILIEGLNELLAVSTEFARSKRSLVTVKSLKQLSETDLGTLSLQEGTVYSFVDGEWSEYTSFKFDTYSATRFGGWNTKTAASCYPAYGYGYDYDYDYYYFEKEEDYSKVIDKDNTIITIEDGFISFFGSQRDSVVEFLTTLPMSTDTKEAQSVLKRLVEKGLTAMQFYSVCYALYTNNWNDFYNITSVDNDMLSEIYTLFIDKEKNDFVVEVFHYPLPEKELKDSGLFSIDGFFLQHYKGTKYVTISKITGNKEVIYLDETPEGTTDLFSLFIKSRQSYMSVVVNKLGDMYTCLSLTDKSTIAVKRQNSPVVLWDTGTTGHVPLLEIIEKKADRKASYTIDFNNAKVKAFKEEAFYALLHKIKEKRYLYESNN